ncbi:MAG TPA: phage tail protein [Thermoanaerobaculia bacterium]|nr:phage tail protein [Thermoanaerobaculia bacterium]
MAPPTRVDPFTVLNFRLEIQGLAASQFSECNGLTSEVEVIEYRSGGQINTVRKIPGLRKFPNLTLKRGITKDRELWEWHKTVLDGVTKRRDGSVVLLNAAGSEVLRWNFRQGWPTKYEGPALNASSDEVAIETLEIAHEGLELA